MIRLTYMNETNLTNRQKLILNIINQSNGLGRKAIQKELAKTYEVSKPTLVRDLNILLGKKLIKIKGRGKKTRYFAYSENPLLRLFDINQYFIYGPDERTSAKKNFDCGIFKNLKRLLLLSEIEKINRIKKVSAGRQQD